MASAWSGAFGRAILVQKIVEMLQELAAVHALTQFI
jgi:hypothetical protein